MNQSMMGFFTTENLDQSHTNHILSASPNGTEGKGREVSTVGNGSSITTGKLCTSPTNTDAAAAGVPCKAALRTGSKLGQAKPLQKCSFGRTLRLVGLGLCLEACGVSGLRLWRRKTAVKKRQWFCVPPTTGGGGCPLVGVGGACRRTNDRNEDMDWGICQASLNKDNTCYCGPWPV